MGHLEFYLSRKCFRWKYCSTAETVAKIVLGFVDIDVNGQSNIKMTNVNTELFIEGEVEKVGGVDFMRIKKLNFIPKPESIVFGVTGLGVFINFI